VAIWHTDEDLEEVRACLEDVGQYAGEWRELLGS
jgi:hypothetical protein